MASVSTPSRKQLVRTGTLSAGVLLVAALFLILNYLGWKYHHRFDWTAGGVYTLSEKSRNVLKDLDRDVEFVVFLTPGDELYQPVRELLSQYDAESQRVSVRYFDPERNPVEAQQLIQRYGVSNTGLVVAVSGDDRRAIDSSELAEMDYQFYAPFIMDSSASRGSSASPAPSSNSPRGASRGCCSPPAMASARSTTATSTASPASRRSSAPTTSSWRSGPRSTRRRCPKEPT